MCGDAPNLVQNRSAINVQGSPEDKVIETKQPTLEPEVPVSNGELKIAAWTVASSGEAERPGGLVTSLSVNLPKQKALEYKSGNQTLRKGANPESLKVKRPASANAGGSENIPPREVGTKRERN